MIGSGDLEAIRALDAYLRRKFAVDPPKRMGARMVWPRYCSVELELTEIVGVVREALAPKAEFVWRGDPPRLRPANAPYAEQGPYLTAPETD